METWKNSADVLRFKHSLKKAVERLENDAFLYGYDKEAAYLQTINYLNNQINELSDKVKEKLW